MSAFACLAAVSLACFTQDADGKLSLELRSRGVLEHQPDVRTQSRQVDWNPAETALILIDVWDRHWCEGATRRVGELAPRIDEVARKLRDQGVFIIHAPSSCMKAYRDHPARLRAMNSPVADNTPTGISHWNRRIPSEEAVRYPIDQSDEGCDCSPRCSHGSPWRSQVDAIHIDGQRDAISDSGVEIWNLLEERGIRNVLIAGVHANMCIVGRPFGCRNLSLAGKEVALIRDLTDTMYNSRRWPYVSHFRGNDRMIAHIEATICPTVDSSQLVGGKAFRFTEDRDPRVVFWIAEPEYQTARTLPQFARTELEPRRLRAEWILEEKGGRFQNFDALEDADLLVLSVRRKRVRKEELERFRNYLSAGKPLLAIRTASHAFAPRDRMYAPDTEWRDFDTEVLGAKYLGHFNNKGQTGMATMVRAVEAGRSDAILQDWRPGTRSFRSQLYKFGPLSDSAKLLLEGQVGRDTESLQPVAWTHSFGKSRVFYTSLGGPEDFESEEFRNLLTHATFWLLDRPLPEPPPDPSPKSKP